MIKGMYVETFNLTESCPLYIIDIKSPSQELKESINKYIVKICEGDSGSEIQSVKKEFLKFLSSKNGGTTEKGAIAEFFVHLFLNSLDFKQECRFFNLEENSIKKGFDGYYSFNGLQWIMESKSGTQTQTNPINHTSKINEAYKDLSTKIKGQCTNNPWKNAYNHASHIDVGSTRGIRLSIKKLSDDFNKNLFPDMSTLNIIPCSTIFFENIWNQTEWKNEIKKLKAKLKDFKYNNLILICITKQSKNILYEIIKDN